jgi:type II secretory pathway pseudopilin PulG
MRDATRKEAQPREARPAGDSRGFTLLELVIVASVVMLVVGGATVVVLHLQRSFDDLMRNAAVRQAGESIVQRLSEELPAADPDSVLPLVLAASDTITWSPVIGHDGTDFVVGPAVQIQHEAAFGETKNDLDDNGDGRVDEGFLTYTVGGTKTDLAGNIVGARFSAETNGVSFEIDVAVSDREGGTIARTFARRIAFRN